MPYCPKCDMEFIDGITKCTDCGGPLFESKEAAEEMLKKAQEKYNEQMRKQYEQMMAAQQKEEAARQAAEKAQTAAAAAAAQQAPKRKASAGTYVDKGQKYDDMNSSATAFFIVGGAAAIVLVLSLTGIISLPFAGVMKYIMTGLIAFMAIGSFAVAFSSKKSAAVLKTQISDEKDQTKEILDWFVEKYSGDDIDRRIFFEESGLSPEEMSLRRFEWIQDLLITGKDLTDQAYIDMLCDEIYSRLFEK